MPDFRFPHHDLRYEPSPVNIGSVRTFPVHTARGSILSRINHATFARGSYQEFLHDGHWSESRDPAVTAIERHRHVAEVAVKHIMRIARRYNYEEIPDIGYNPKTRSYSGFTPDQTMEWLEFHKHCGVMPEHVRARIIMEMQKDLRCTAEEFHDTIIRLEEEFRHHCYGDLPLPDGFHLWDIEEQGDYLSETSHPHRKQHKMPELPQHFGLWTRERKQDWYAKHRRFYGNTVIPDGFHDWHPDEQSDYFSEIEHPRHKTHPMPELPQFFGLWNRERKLAWYEKHGHRNM